jgi:hypothetical protein
MLARSPVLAVRHVEVQGGSHTDPSAILTASGLRGHHQLTDIDPSAIRQRVLALPWVAQVSVEREWPGTIRIRVTERRPLAEVVAAPPVRPAATDATIDAIVDKQGRVLASGQEAMGLLAGSLRGLPTLGGVGPAGAAGTSLGPTAGPALTLLQGLILQGLIATPATTPATTPAPAPGTMPAPTPAPTPVGSGRVSGLTVPAVSRAADGTLRALLAPGPVTVVFGTTDRLAAKVTAARSLLAQVPPGVSATIDVQVVDAPVLTND